MLSFFVNCSILAHCFIIPTLPGGEKELGYEARCTCTRTQSSPVPVPDMHAMAATTTEPRPLEQAGRSEAAVTSQRPALCITEKWIRERLNLQLDSLGQHPLNIPLDSNYAYLHH